MSREYYRVTEAITYNVGRLPAIFAESGERVVHEPNYGSDGTGVYRNKINHICWIPWESVRPETSKEALEELLTGEW